MTIKIALLTSCTVSRNFDPIVRIQDAPVVGTMDELLAWWTRKMDAALNQKRAQDVLKTPGELYAGTSFDVITEIAQTIGHDNIYIVTGGVGLTKYTDKIVPYDFTSDRKVPHNAAAHVTGEKFMPQLWWGKINHALHGDPNPIRALTEHYDIIVGALPKMFIMYIVQDLQGVSLTEREHKIFIPVPRSMIGSIPKIARGAFVPYDATYLVDVYYTRYDKAQRVAQKFLHSCTTLKNATKHAADIIKMGQDAAIVDPRDAKDVNYDTIFKDFPLLLEADDVGSAIHRAKVLGVKIGGRHRFAGAWRGAKGMVKLETTQKDLMNAKSALQTMLSSARPKEYRDVSKILQQLALFIQAVQETRPDLIFTAQDVAAWGKLTFSGDKVISSAPKISYVLNYHTKHLNIERVSVGSTYGYKTRSTSND